METNQKEKSVIFDSIKTTRKLFHFFPGDDVNIKFHTDYFCTVSIDIQSFELIDNEVKLK